jgi:diadenosine tetraphosphatase ApaH/serine/threonine PP2A family protein phosphatase
MGHLLNLQLPDQEQKTLFFKIPFNRTATNPRAAAISFEQFAFMSEICTKIQRIMSRLYVISPPMSTQPFDVVLSEYSHLLDPLTAIPESDLILPKFQVDLIFDLLDLAVNQLAPRNALIKVHSPAVIVGDIHGSITDLLRILRHHSDYATTTSLLFLGDYVDRGAHSVPVIVLLLALLCKHPSTIFLLRGNHEFAHINRVYGFFDEIMSFCNNSDLWGQFQTVFSYLPLAAIVDSQLFCVHGGLSPELTSLEQISKLSLPIRDYFVDPMIADLVWSDPSDRILDFVDNQRGSGVLFGIHAVKTFLGECGLKAIIRAHQCVGDGWLTFAENCGITVFSSSDYCKLQHNRAAVIRVTEDAKLEFFCVTDDSGKPKVTMCYAQQLGLKRVFARTQGEVALRSRLATKFNSKKTTMVTPKAQKMSKPSPVKRTIQVEGQEEDGQEN